MCLLVVVLTASIKSYTYFTPFPLSIELLLNEKLIAFAPNLVFSQAVYILQKDTEDNP